jgi:hypothetical protein
MYHMVEQNKEWPKFNTPRQIIHHYRENLEEVYDWYASKLGKDWHILIIFIMMLIQMPGSCMPIEMEFCPQAETME